MRNVTAAGEQHFGLGPFHWFWGKGRVHFRYYPKSMRRKA